MRTWIGQGTVALLAALWAVPSSAALVARYFDGDATADAYYDDDLGITWLANANAGLGSSFDTAGGGASDGRMNWANANAWAASLDLDGTPGVDGWRLPDTDPINGSSYNYSYAQDGSTDIGYNVGGPGSTYAGNTGSEMAHMFYDELGNKGYCPVSGSYPQFGSGLTNTVPFSNVQSGYYWSGTQYAPYASVAWHFYFYDGYQHFAGKVSEFSAWAVHSGDVGAATPVPVPAAAWLLGSGLLGLFGVARPRRLALG
ncbi:MAG: DUF1566 domain-containing protein [Steroidobacteraceae bacterium]